MRLIDADAVMKDRYITIMGETWHLSFHSPLEDELLQTRYGYSDESTREIVISTDIESVAKGKKQLENRIIRHEIVHAFLFECGLSSNAHGTECWADDEEIVDWIELTGAKIYKVWEELGVL